jgi:hypothetical protein
MNTDESRKRSASQSASSPERGTSVKRLCQGSAPTNSRPRSSLSSRLSSPSSSQRSSSRQDKSLSPTAEAPIISPSSRMVLPSVKDLLSVPVAYIFRQVAASSGPSPCSFRSGTPQHQQSQQQPSRGAPKPLLSRTEALCLLRVQALAAQIDSLVELSARLLSDQVACQAFHQELLAADARPLRALLVLVRTRGTSLVPQGLAATQAAWTPVLEELESLAEALRQSSEQNYSTSETLLEAAVGEATAAVMAREKRYLSDVQDELAQRIDRLLQTTVADSPASEDTPEVAPTTADPWGEEAGRRSMSDFCRQLWTGHLVVHSPSRAPSSSQNSRVSAITGKENDGPSQQSIVVVEDSPAACRPTESQHHAALVLSTLAGSATPHASSDLSRQSMEA